MMDIGPAQIARKAKIGRLGENPVYELATIGGLHLCVLVKGSKFEVIGTGSHRAIAKHVARKRCPEIVWTDLSKSDPVEDRVVQNLLPRYEALTEALRTAQR